MSAVDDRYRRQVLFEGLGRQGQARLESARVLVVGLGATGGTAAELLVRAGVGSIVLVDRDVVCLDNLHRQVLFDEADAAQEIPKALAATRHLEAINSSITIEGYAAHFEAANGASWVNGATVVVDGTDNVETRYLINDLACRYDVPWIYTGAVGGEGMLLPVIPGTGPCLRCVFPEPAPPGTLATCDTAGVVGPVSSIMGSLAALEAIKVIVGVPAREKLLAVDLWKATRREIAVRRNSACRACVEAAWDFLDGERVRRVVELCGRDTFQVLPPLGTELDLQRIGERLEAIGDVRRGPGVLRCDVPPHVVTLFSDGRALVHGAGNADEARGAYDRFVGG